MDQRLIRILGGTTEHYPYALENKHPRILKKIMSLWDEDEIDNYFMELMVGDRGDRGSFTPDVAADIIHLSLVHASQEAPDKQRDVWGATPDAFVKFAPRPTSGEDWTDLTADIKTELQKFDIPCTPEGFFDAAETGNCAAVALFMEAQISTEIRDNLGRTPLMIAAEAGRDEIVDLLIQHKAEINVVDMGGNSALHWAAFGGCVDCAKRLIKNHAKINARNHFGWTPLLQATARNHFKVALLLIDRDASLDIAADDGYTALHKAAASGYIEIVQLLLDKGADKTLKTRNGDTPAMLAIKNKQEAAINLLMPGFDSTDMEPGWLDTNGDADD